MSQASARGLSLHLLTRTLDLLTDDANLVVRLCLLPSLHCLHLLAEQVRGLGRIDGFGERIIIDALLEDTNAVMVASNLVVRVIFGLRHVLVGIDVDVGLSDGGGKSDFASGQSIFAELLSFDLLDDGPGVVGLPLVIAKDLRRVRGLWLEIWTGGLV